MLTDDVSVYGSRGDVIHLGEHVAVTSGVRMVPEPMTRSCGRPEAFHTA